MVVISSAARNLLNPNNISDLQPVK